MIERTDASDSEAASGRPSSALKPFAESMVTVVEQMDSLYNSSQDISGLPTGLRTLDLITGGLRAGELAIVAGRPRMGKSTLLHQIARHIAAEQGLPVALFTPSSTAEHVARRIIAAGSDIPYLHLDTGRLLDEHWAKLTDCIASHQSAQLYIDDSPRLSADTLRVRALDLASQCGKVGMVLVDYVQLLEMPPWHEVPRSVATADALRTLKALARELRCPVVAASTIGRAIDLRPNKRPLLSDISEIGAIDDIADLLVFVYQDEQYNPDSYNRGICELIIAKNSNGLVGTTAFAFDARIPRFTERDSSSSSVHPSPKTESETKQSGSE